MTKYLKYLMLILTLVQLTSCRELYEPILKPGNSGFLVVDGIIINGKDKTIVSLTRTTGLHDSITTVYEQNAIVELQGEDSSAYFLTEESEGQYTTDSLNLNSGKSYRLKIRTADGNLYMSDFVPVLATPPIDSVSWTQEKDPENFRMFNLNIYVSTHDPENNTRHYLWNYEETWKYHSPVKSYVKMVDDSIMLMSIDEQEKMYFCWQSAKSKSILIGNSVKLSQDAISMNPLTSVKGNSLKKSFVYSINVKQYALTQKAYEFYEIMQKNSEQTGTLFDPQPSEINGNIRNASNPSETVIGFVSISSLEEKRIYIDKNFSYNYVGSCLLENYNSLDVSRISYPAYYPVNYIINLSTSKITGYVLAAKPCVDCEMLGGSNVKPSFWPDNY
jgi:hypothetical protein